MIEIRSCYSKGKILTCTLTLLLSGSSVNQFRCSLCISWPASSMDRMCLYYLHAVYSSLYFIYSQGQIDEATHRSALRSCLLMHCNVAFRLHLSSDWSQLSVGNRYGPYVITEMSVSSCYEEKFKKVYGIRSVDAEAYIMGMRLFILINSLHYSILPFDF